MHCTAFTPWYFQDKYLASQLTKSSTKNIQVLLLFYLNAARYSASPIGGSSPPVKAMFTLKPTPGPLPTCKTHIHARLGYNVRINSGSIQVRRQTDWCSFLPHQVLHCQGRSSHHHSDAVTGREHWGLCRRPAGCHYHGEHPGYNRKGRG